MKKSFKSKNEVGSIGNTRLLPQAKMLLVPMTFFRLWGVDYTSEEKVLTEEM